MPVMKRKVGGCVVNQIAKHLLLMSGAISGTRSFQSNQEGTSLIGSLDPRDATCWVHSCLQMAKRLKGKGLFQMYGFAGRKGDMELQGEKWVSERHRWLSNTNAERELPSAPLIILQWVTHITFRSERSAVSNSRWWVFLMNWIPECAWRRGRRSPCLWFWFPRSSWQLTFPGWLLGPHRSCTVPSGARNNSHVKSHFRIEQSYLCPARFQMQWKKNVWTDGGIHLFHFPLVNLRNSFACGMFVFRTFNFFPRYKIQYLKVGSGKVNQIALTLIPQMCLFVHV